MIKYAHYIVMAAAAGVAAAACDNGTTVNPVAPSNVAPPVVTTNPPPGPSPVPSLPAIYAQFGNGTQVSLEGSMVVLRTIDVPDHPSPYFAQGSPQYEAPQPGTRLNPHHIVAQNLTLRVPVSPTVGSPSDTPLGPIGIATNGVVFFNQYAMMRQPLTTEIISFDRYNGHPAPSNTYHYHFEPVWLTQSGKSRFVGVLLDGFPVYGPLEGSGATPTDLDSCHGHVGVTAEFPAGLYHYHTTADPPYISGCFRGAPGTIG